MPQYYYYIDGSFKNVRDPVTHVRCRTGQSGHKFVEQQLIDGVWTLIGGYDDVAGAGCRFREGVRDGNYVVDKELEIGGFSLAEDEGWENIGGAEGWAAWWASQPEVLFFGLYSDISGGQMPNRVPGATDYLTVAGALGAETYQCPNTAPYIAADTDYIWFDIITNQRTATTAQLIGSDFSRTIIKYGDIVPYAIEWIMILSDDFETARENKMRDSFHLSIWWDGFLSSYGNLKGNRGIGRSIWVPTPILDRDGNVYTSVVIGTQTWLVENLKTTKYNDGTAIPTGLSNANWALEDGTTGHDGAFAQANNDSGNKAAYGLLYNQYAVLNAKGICPIGYRAPTLTEINTFITFLGGVGLAGGYLKENGSFTYFNSPNTGAVNSVGWCGRGAGYRVTTGSIGSFKEIGAYWGSTNRDRFYLSSMNDNVGIGEEDLRYGYSVRCIKD